MHRLKDAGHKPQPVQGTVRGGLNTRGQQVDCSYSMSFPISFMSENCNCNTIKCNKQQCKLAIVHKETTAKLLPIDYDIIIGLPSIRKWNLIKLIPSVFLDENKLSIGDSARPGSGVGANPIFASYAESVRSNRDTQSGRSLA